MADRTRRRVVACVGTALGASLAGCSALPFGDREPTIAGDDLAAIASEPTPSIPDRLPVDIDPSYLGSVADTVRERLDTVPAPLDASHVPNGAMRADLAHARAHATEALAAADDAPTPWERADRLRRARGRAGYLAGGWAAVDDDRTIPDVRGDAERLREDLADFRRAWAYVGADPIDSVVVHHAIGDLLRGCIADLNDVLSARERASTTALDVAEADEALAGARGALRDADHLFGRLADADGVRDRRETFASAAATLAARVDERRRAVVSTETATGDARTGPPAVYALAELRERFEYADDVGEARRTGAFPRAILAAHDELATIGAVERLRERVDAGEVIDPESAEDVRAIRSDAREALVEARRESAYPTLDRRRLHELAAGFAYVDDSLGRYDADDEIEIARLRRELARYVSIGATARAVGDASASVADVFDATG
ncbi:hypothetical protein [Halobaculum sp. EA56]|uniref:hypothetical protein n=1 Tax=Halobaculum sp. EA56 TaxID=3421648 RepID=UPI003EBA5148